MLGTLLPLQIMAAATSPASSGEPAATGPVMTGTEGLGRLYHTESGYRWELPDSVLGRAMSLFITLLNTPTKVDKDAKYGYEGDRFGPMILRFVDDGESVRLEQAVGMELPDDGTPAARLHNEARTWNTRNWLPILRRDAGSVTIDAEPLLTDDQLFGLQSASFMLKLGMCIDNDPGFREIRQIPGGVIVRSTRTYTSIPFPGRRIDTTRWQIGASLSLLPREKMAARYFDQRVGYFEISGQSVRENGSELAAAGIVKRWNQEPAPCDTARYNRGETVVPQNKIVFYLDRYFPKRWKETTRRAAANWEPAFEAAGFRDAIEVREADDDPSCTLDNGQLTWIKFTSSPNENAYGRPYTDLRNGEVQCALIRIFDASFNLERRWHISQMGDVMPMSEEMEERMFESVLTHEIGHVLGLEHNFYGSTRFETEQLRNPELMRYETSGSSIMDYLRLNHAVQPEDGVAAEDLIPRVGPYDLAAIEWGYRSWSGCDQGTVNDSLSRRAAVMFADRNGRYLPQHNTRDPQVMAEDLGRHPLETIELGMRHLQRALEALEAPIPGMLDTTLILQAVRAQFGNYVGQVSQHIGGRRRVFDRPEELFRPVGAEEHREALAFFARYVVIPPIWMNRLLETDLREDLAASLLGRLVLVEENALIGSNYPVDAYLTDLEKLFLGEAFDAEPTEERRAMAESYLTALDGFAGDPSRGITLRVKCRQRMETLREQFAESGNPYWNGVCERIAARNENTEEAA